MSETNIIDNSEIEQWIIHKLSSEKIQELLHAKGMSDESIRIYLKEYKRQRYGKQQAKGFILTSIGAFLGFISCLLAVFNPIPELFDLILYGLTSLAILLIFIGLYFVFE
jgi:hypothetical protein